MKRTIGLVFGALSILHCGLHFGEGGEPLQPRSGQPLVHRAAAPRCVAARGTEPPLFGTDGGDASSQCTKGGVDGRLTSRYVGAGGSVQECTYDQCDSDAACGVGKVCDCRTDGRDSRASRCVAALCRTDADCESAFCGESTFPGAPEDTVWACHSSRDLCVEDAQCVTSVPSACAYLPSERRFRCVKGGVD